MTDDTRTYGEQFRAEHPDWQHECCFEPVCQHRYKLEGVVRCGSPAECDYYCGKKEAPCPR